MNNGTEIEKKIKSSLEWPKVRMAIERELKILNYNGDLRRMLSAIDGMVTDLSKLEVIARQTKRPDKCATKISEINSAINDLDGWIIIATLSE